MAAVMMSGGRGLHGRSRSGCMMPPRGFPLLGLRYDPHHPPLHHRHRWSHHHPRSRPALHPPHHWPLRYLPWGVVGPTRAPAVKQRVRRGGERVRTTRLQVFPTCTAHFKDPSHFTVHVVPLPGPLWSRTTPLCTGVALDAVRSSADHPSGWTSREVHRHLSPWATYGRGAIAQRVGMGLRPGKLRKKALGKGTGIGGDQSKENSGM